MLVLVMPANPMAFVIWIWIPRGFIQAAKLLVTDPPPLQFLHDFLPLKSGEYGGEVRFVNCSHKIQFLNADIPLGVCLDF